MWLCSVRWAMKYWLSFDFAVLVVPLSSSALLGGRTGCSCVLWARSYVAASWLLVGWLSDLLQEWQNRLCAKKKGAFKRLLIPNTCKISFKHLLGLFAVVSDGVQCPLIICLQSHCERCSFCKALWLLQLVGTGARHCWWQIRKSREWAPSQWLPSLSLHPFLFFLFFSFFSLFFSLHIHAQWQWWAPNDGLRRFHLNFAYGAAQQSSRWSLSFFLSGYSPSMRNLACNSKKVELLSHSLY